MRPGPPRKPWHRALLIFLAVTVSSALPISARAQSWNLYEGGGFVDIPYRTGGIDDSPTIGLKLDDVSGAPIDFVMDTGSVGILASPDNFTPGPDSKNLGPGKQIYTSSGKIEHGTWYTATQHIYSGDRLVAIADVPVLQVTRITCLPGARDCTPNDHPTGIAQMGIGFARENSSEPAPETHGPDYNPFLNLTGVRLAPDGPLQALPADWHDGYVVTDKSVKLGLTAENTANAGFVKLLPDPLYSTATHTEWQATPMTVTVNGVSGQGTVLFDTGLGYGILTPPPGAPIGPLVACPAPVSTTECLPPGTTVAVSLPGQTNPAAFYSFTVGASGDPMAPPSVVVFADGGTFFNTSRHVLTGVHYIYDAEHGLVGYRWLDKAGTTGFVNLAVALQGPFPLRDGFTSSLPVFLFGPTVLEPSGTAAFAGPITGASSLTIDGPGTVILSGVNAYSGPTIVKSGTLRVNGSIVSPVTVESGGVLGGTGQLGAVTVNSGGVYAPGNSIGTQTVNGGFTLNPGAIYEVEVNAAGQSDKVIVAGTVNLTGSVLRVLAASGDYKPKTDYLIVDNDGADAVVGTFASITSSLAFLTPSVVYDAGDGNDVVLTLLRTVTPNGPLSFCSAANTRNQCNVANALDRFPTDNPLFLAVLNQTAAGARQAFDALSGEIHATLPGLLADESRYVREAMLGRLMQASYTDKGGQIASLGAAGPQVSMLSPAPQADANAMALGYRLAGDDKALGSNMPPRIAFWTRGFGAWGDFEGNGNAATADRDLGGFVSGMDAQVSGTWRAGLAAGGSWSNVSVDARRSSAEIDSFHLGGYLGGLAGPLALRAGGAWSFQDIDTSRAVLFPGFFERQESSYDADTGQVFGEIAYPLASGNIALEPFGGLAYVSVETDSFREHGGALAALNGSGKDQDIGYSTLGLRAATTMHWGATLIVPHLSAAWQHAFDDVTPGAALAFASTGIGFGVSGVPLTQDSALLEAGLDFALSPAATLGVSYTGQIADKLADNAVKGRLTWLF